DTMPTILEWLGLEVPRQCDGRSLLAFCETGAPADWRTEAHYEFDFRDLFYTRPETSLGIPMDKCSLAVVQDEACKYVHFAARPFAASASGRVAAEPVGDHRSAARHRAARRFGERPHQTALGRAARRAHRRPWSRGRRGRQAGPQGNGRDLAVQRRRPLPPPR